MVVFYLRTITINVKSRMYITDLGGKVPILVFIWWAHLFIFRLFIYRPFHFPGHPVLSPWIVMF